MGTKTSFVLSASEFKSKSACLAKITKWEDEGMTKNPPFVYEVVKKYKPVRVWKLVEETL